MVSPSNETSAIEKDAKSQAAVLPEKALSSFGLHKLHDHVEITLENCLLSGELLDTSPSLQDGLDVETERDLRYLGCELIQLSSVLLKLPQVAAATGQILFQRFYYAKSFVRYNFEQTAMACLNLASKIEEAPRRFRDVINVFHHLKQIYRLKEGKGHQKK
ncbi:unnamed protein product [Soboliphyme baturini]|uniref:CYCLIN domain-containing protein n=1 Tax=Soboliphyme baturini TaxID=241478 RepID=A0A183IUX1_9BILA|nr:unnamed protein product [Soboliphyme baturini]